MIEWYKSDRPARSNIIYTWCVLSMALAEGQMYICVSPRRRVYIKRKIMTHDVCHFKSKSIIISEDSSSSFLQVQRQLNKTHYTESRENSMSIVCVSSTHNSTVFSWRILIVIVSCCDVAVYVCVCVPLSGLSSSIREETLILRD